MEREDLKEEEEEIKHETDDSSDDEIIDSSNLKNYDTNLAKKLGMKDLDIKVNRGEWDMPMILNSTYKIVREFK